MVVAEIREVWNYDLTRETTKKELIEICDLWGQALSLTGPYVAGGSMEDAFIETVMISRVIEKAPPFRRKLPSTKD